MPFLGSALPQFLPARRADRVLIVQLTLALVIVLLLLSLVIVWQQDLFHQVVALCEGAAGAFFTQSWALAALVPLVLVGIILSLASLSMFRQLWATRRLLQALGPIRPLSPELARLGSDLGLDGHLRLIADPRPLAFSAGLASPIVWLSTGLVEMLDLDALTAVLRHEAHHVRHRDPLKLLLARALATALFFLPLARELNHAYEIHKELEADAEAEVTPTDRRGLARAIYLLLARDVVNVNQAAVGSMFNRAQVGATGARLERLTGNPTPSLIPRRRSVLLTVFAVLLVLAIGLFPMAQPARAEWGGSCEEARPTPVVLSLDPS